jgi:hypothetical protein
VTDRIALGPGEVAFDGAFEGGSREERSIESRTRGPSRPLHTGSERVAREFALEQLE